MYGNYSKKVEHAFKTIQKDIKDGSLPSVLLLCGKEQFLVDWAIKQIIGKYVELASKVLDLTVLDEDPGFSQIIENCETLPLLSEKKIVVVRDSKIFTTQSSELDRFIDYLAKIPETTKLIFIQDSVDRKRKLPKAIIKHGKIYDFDQLDKKELISFVNKRFKSHKIMVSPDIMDYLIEETGYYNKESDYDLFTFSNDITKMIALTEDGVLRRETVKNTVESDIETFIFELMNSLSEGKKDRAFQLIHNIASDKSDVSLLVAMIVSQYELMYSIKALAEDRVPDRLIAEKLDIKEARLRVLKPFSMRYTKNKLRESLKYAYEIDRNIKMGLLRPVLALEMFVARI